MSVQVSISDELAKQIDTLATDRAAFVTEAVRRFLRESCDAPSGEEVALINQLADELNREARDVLEYQVIP